MRKSQIVLVGGGGHCRSCIDVIESEDQYEIAGIIDNDETLYGRNILGYPIIGGDNDLQDLSKKIPYAMITLGQIKTAVIRNRLYDILVDYGFILPKIISPLAYVSKHAQIGSGTIVMHHAIINSSANVGNNCIVNTKALLEHDTFVDDNCHISTASVINGHSRIGSNTFIGSGTIIRENVLIGKNCVIGAGSIVKKSIEDNNIYIDRKNV